jgi:hypothetical protein
MYDDDHTESHKYYASHVTNMLVPRCQKPCLILHRKFKYSNTNVWGGNGAMGHGRTPEILNRKTKINKKCICLFDDCWPHIHLRIGT